MELSEKLTQLENIFSEYTSKAKIEHYVGKYFTVKFETTDMFYLKLHELNEALSKINFKFYAVNIQPNKTNYLELPQIGIQFDLEEIRNENE